MVVVRRNADARVPWAAWAVLGASLTAATLTAQTQQPPPIRGGVTFVNVDVYPRKSDGTIDLNLARQDFELFEDGVAQTIDTFELVKRAPGTDGDRRDPNTLADSDRQVADPRNRAFVIYLDLAHVGVVGSLDARRPIVEFLTGAIGASDLFAVMTPEMPVSQMVFGRRTETIESELAKYLAWGWGDDVNLRLVPARTPEERAIVEACAFADPSVVNAAILRHREDRLMSNLEALVSKLGGLREARTHVLFISQGWVPRPPASDTGTGTKPEVPTISTRGGRIGLGDPQNGNIDRTACASLTARLNSIDFDQRFREMVTRAARANLSFHPLDVRGLAVDVAAADITVGSKPGDYARAVERTTIRREAQETLRILAADTDGVLAMNTNDLTAGANRIAAATSAYYLLGYSSTNARRDGRYRRIEVKVRQPGLTVASRRGYVAEAPAAAASAPNAAAPASPVTGALDRLATLGARDLFLQGASGPEGLDVVVEIAGATAERPAWRNGADVRVVAVSESGESREASTHLQPGVRSVAMQVPVDASDAGPWRVTARAAAPSAEPIEESATVAAAPPALVAPATRYRTRPGARAAVYPAAEPLFARSEVLRLTWRQLAMVDKQTARLLNRQGQPIAAELPLVFDGTGPGSLTRVDLPLASLASGDYIVELVVASGATTEQHLVPFRVGR